ncbi:MAG: alpha/beta hydrolase [Planctomycetota bacterium]|nr:MAG: alpha/beta hydrolase [Planctomycetota bacterium]
MFARRLWRGEGVDLVGFEAEAGSQPPLLLLHGVSRCRHTFAPLFPWLVPRLSLLAYDHRGHGDSQHAVGYRVVDYAADCISVVSRMQSRVILYGHSLGALVALATAAALPEKIAGLVLEDPPGPAFLATVDRSPYAALFTLYQTHAGSTLAVGELAARLAAAAIPAGSGTEPTTFGATRDLASIRFTAACLKSLDPATMDPLLAGAWLEGIDWPAVLRGVTCPALVLRADPARGGMLPDGDFLALRETLPDITAIDLTGIGHNAVGQQPDIVPKYVIPFLETLPVVWDHPTS